MDREDITRVIEAGIDNGLEVDEIVRDLQRRGVTLAPGPRHPDDIKAIDLLNRWHWLMIDVAGGRAYSRVSYNNSVWIAYDDPIGAFVDAPEGVENWCGVTAGVVGMAALAGFFEGLELRLENGKLAGEPDWDRFDDGVLVPDDYAAITEAEPYADPTAAATAISMVLEERYAMIPTPLEDYDRPWLGVDAPFQPKPKPRMRW